MMFRRIVLAALVLTTSTVVAFAADLGGKWTAKFDTQIGTMNYTYEFHVDGSKVTGTTANDDGAVKIQEGKVDGDTVTFVEVRQINGSDLKITYTGKIDGDQINFTRDVGGFVTEQIVAHRSK